jgi:hypothetical protein
MDPGSSNKGKERRVLFFSLEQLETSVDQMMDVLYV